MGFNCIAMDLETKQSNLNRVSVFYLLGALLVAGSNGCTSSAEKWTKKCMKGPAIINI